MAQCKTQTMGPLAQPFHSGLRGDVTSCRFEVPKANVTCNANGCTAIGLADRPTRKIISHEFESQKQQENSASLDRLEAVPGGQRYAAAAEWHEQRQQERLQQEQAEDEKQKRHELDSLQGIVRQLPEYLTSSNNPLIIRPSTAPAGTAGTDEDATPEYEFASRPHSPEVAARIQTARNLDSSLAVGSMEPLVDHEAEQREKEQQSLLAMLIAEHQQRVLEAEQLAEQMVRLYPHGVPKRIQLQLHQQGVELPRPGFGCSHTVPAREVAFAPMR